MIAGGNGNSDTNNDNESPNSGVSIPACVQIPTSSDGTNVQGQQQQQNLDSSRMEDVQQFLWGASGGIEWQGKLPNYFLISFFFFTHSLTTLLSIRNG